MNTKYHVDLKITIDCTLTLRVNGQDLAWINWTSI